MAIIDPNKPIDGITTIAKPSTRPAEGQNGTFKDIFQQTVAAAENKPNAAQSPMSISGIRPAQFDALASPSASFLADQVGALIDTMAAYQQKLVEEGATLKTMAPLVDKMARQTAALGKMADSAGADGALKSILEQSLAVASMEISRYKSGQYND